MTLLLVRHGESTWNVAGRVQGQTPHPPLTERGRVQARAAAAELAAYRPTRLWTSDLVRAAQTADIVGPALGLVPRPEPLLRERHWGALQGRAGAAAWAEVGRWRATGGPPGGEEVAALARRVRRVLAAAAGAPAPVALVTHGAWIAVAWGLVHGDEPPDPPPNGSVTAVDAVPTWISARRR